MKILMIWHILYGYTVLLWLYCAYIFYRSKNGALRKSLIFLCISVGIASALRIFLGDLFSQEITNISVISLIVISLTIFAILITKYNKWKGE